MNFLVLPDFLFSRASLLAQPGLAVCKEEKRDLLTVCPALEHSLPGQHM